MFLMNSAVCELPVIEIIYMVDKNNNFITMKY